MTQNLRTSLIKLAHSNAELRAHLLPILTAGLSKTALEFDTQEQLEKYQKTHDVRSDTNLSVRSHGDMRDQHQQDAKKSRKDLEAAQRQDKYKGGIGESPDILKHKNLMKGHQRAVDAHQFAATSPSAKNTATAHALTSVVKNHKGWHADVHHQMLKHNLLDDDSEQLKKFKGNKPNHGTPISDQVLMQRFLAKAKPETKERMKNMSVADFKKMYAAINADEE